MKLVRYWIFFRWQKYVFLMLVTSGFSNGHPGKCDQTPPAAVDKEPREDNHPFSIGIDNPVNRDGKISYTADQTYVCKY